MKYYFIEKIFNNSAVKDLRNLIENNYEKYSNFQFEKKYINDPIFKYILSSEIINFLDRNLEDDYYLFHSFVIQKNNRTYKKMRYHKDSGKPHQSEILCKKKNIYGKVGIPLQDNIKGIGGGIDILKPFFLDNLSDKNKFINKLRALYYFLLDKLTDTQLKTVVGEVIFFDALLLHRTSYTEEKKTINIPDKYVIYFQLTNLSTIKEVLKKKRNLSKEVLSDDIENNTQTINFGKKKIKILNHKISEEIGSYIGA